MSASMPAICKLQRRLIVGSILVAGAALNSAAGETPNLSDLAPAIVEGRWLRPAAKAHATPRWGHAEGLQVGIAPLPGPRGLLRIYAISTSPNA
jgi:hypothetical protein